MIISSGGASGEPLAWTCTTQSSIDAGYQAIINDYGVNQLDFDVEGAAVADTERLAGRTPPRQLYSHSASLGRKPPSQMQNA